MEAAEKGDEFNKERFRTEAGTLASSLMSDKRQRSYGRQTILKLYMDELKELLRTDNPNEQALAKIIQNFEGHIERGLQESPGDQHLLGMEATFREVLNQEEKAATALRQAFNANRHNPSVAVRLAKYYEAQNLNEKALETLNNSLEGNPNEKILNFTKARLLMKSGLAGRESIIHHLFKSFAPGDNNYEAQFWFARQIFELNDAHRISQSKELFAGLRDAPIPFDRKRKIRDKASKDGVIQRFAGAIMKKPGDYGFVQVDGRADEVFCHGNNSAQWQLLSQGERVTFELGFSYNGPEALDLRSESQS